MLAGKTSLCLSRFDPGNTIFRRRVVPTCSESSFALVFSGRAGSHVAVALAVVAGVSVHAESVRGAVCRGAGAHLGQVAVVLNCPANSSRFFILKQRGGKATPCVQKPRVKRGETDLILTVRVARGARSVSNGELVVSVDKIFAWLFLGFSFREKTDNQNARFSRMLKDLSQSVVAVRFGMDKVRLSLITVSVTRRKGDRDFGKAR